MGIYELIYRFTPQNYLSTVFRYFDYNKGWTRAYCDGSGCFKVSISLPRTARRPLRLIMTPGPRTQGKLRASDIVRNRDS